MSKTGNTKKVAEEIYNELRCEKKIVAIDEVTDIGQYDLAFLGFPMRQFGPDEKTAQFLQ